MSQTGKLKALNRAMRKVTEAIDRAERANAVEEMMALARRAEQKALEFGMRTSTPEATRFHAAWKAGDSATALRHMVNAMLLNPADEWLLAMNAYAAWCAAEVPRKDALHWISSSARFATRGIEPAALPMPEPGRKLRVGFLGVGFRWGCAGYFVAPLLQAHDSDAIEVHVFDDSPHLDDMSRRIARAVHRVHRIAGLSDGAVLKLAREAGIDIMINIQGPVEPNRQAAWAARMAPIQATWIPEVLGSMGRPFDYRITDSVFDPPNHDSHYSERLVRLPRCAVPWTPYPAIDRPLTPSPAARGVVTFGSTAAPIKMSNPTLASWASLLRAVPDAQLVLVRDVYRSPQLTRAVCARLETAGIPLDRVRFVAPGTREECATVHDGIDILLDCWPCSGLTTTMDALWSGVPVVTLAGDRCLARQSASVLHAMGADEWIANTSEEYVQIAARLAADRPALAGIRQTLRSRVAASELLDHSGFARAFEEAIMQIVRSGAERKAA